MYTIERARSALRISHTLLDCDIENNIDAARFDMLALILTKMTCCWIRLWNYIVKRSLTIWEKVSNSSKTMRN